MTRLDSSAVAALLQRARLEVDEGHLPAVQVALGIDGETAMFECFGQTSPDTRHQVFSCTKAVTNSTVWALAGDGLVDLTERVVAYVPEFGSHGKDVVTIEQLLMLTCGIPSGRIGPDEWGTSEGRSAAFARWELDWEPGTRFQYHPGSAHWVLAEVVQRASGADFRDTVHDRVTGPAGIGRVLGLPLDDEGPFAPLSVVADPASTEEMAAFYTGTPPGAHFDPKILAMAGTAQYRAAGVPGGGGLMRAADLVAFYQVLLHDPDGIWRPDVLADATGTVRCMLEHPWWGVPASRSLGMNIANDDGHARLRGLGDNTSARAFGTAGAFGQISWADPETGLSFAYVTSGIDLNDPRVFRRVLELSDLAACCAA